MPVQFGRFVKSIFDGTLGYSCPDRKLTVAQRIKSTATDDYAGGFGDGGGAVSGAAARDLAALKAKTRWDGALTAWHCLASACRRCGLGRCCCICFTCFCRGFRAGRRSRQPARSGFAIGDARNAPDGDAGADDALVAARYAFGRLCADGAGQRSASVESGAKARNAQCAAAGDHRRGDAVWRAARGGGGDGKSVRATGLGTLLLEAIAQRDYRVVQGLTLVIAVMYVLVNLIVDVLYAAVDPRIRV